MNDQEKLKVAREALEEMVKHATSPFAPSYIRGIARSAIDAINAPSTEQPPAASIGEPFYRKRTESSEKERDDLRAQLKIAQDVGEHAVVVAEKYRAQLARPVDLAGLTRYVHSGMGYMADANMIYKAHISPEEKVYLLECDVQALLAGEVKP